MEGRKHAMKEKICLLVVVFGIIGVIGAVARPQESSAPPPLVVDEDDPLLLDEPAKDEEPAAKRAENQPCFVCHVNYTREELVFTHAAQNVGCVDCHGDSFAHRNDENNTTPPDTMYPSENIDKACKECHETHDVPAAAVVAHWLKRYPKKPMPKLIVCTDCHGAHRLKLRTVRWDKKTRKLLLRRRADGKKAE